MEQQLIKTLISQYKEKGIDLYAIVDDPLFVELPLEKKVGLLKQFASHMTAGTSRTLTKKDIHAVLMDAGIGALGGAAAAGIGTVGALGYYARGSGKIPFGAIAASAAIGGGITALGSLLNSRKIYAQRQQMLNSLDTLQASPDDESAIRVLALRNSQVRPNRTLAATSAVVSAAKGYLQSAPVKVMQSIPDHVQLRTMYKNENAGTPYAAGVDESAFDSAIMALRNKVFRMPTSKKP